MLLHYALPGKTGKHENHMFSLKCCINQEHCSSWTVLHAVCCLPDTPVYMIQPVVKPVVQPVWQPPVSCKQTSNRLSKRFNNWLLNEQPLFVQPVVSCKRGLKEQELIRRWDSERELLRSAPGNLPAFAEIKQNNGHYAAQGHARSPILVPIESSYTISY